MSTADAAYDSAAFDELEKVLLLVAKDGSKLTELWEQAPASAGATGSERTLAAIRTVCQQQHPLLSSKDCAELAYQQQGSQDGTDNAETCVVAPKDFPKLLLNLLYFNKLFACFQQQDGPGDRVLDAEEFAAGVDRLGMQLGEDATSESTFSDLAEQSDGAVRFEALCAWYSQQVQACVLPSHETGVADGALQLVAALAKSGKTSVDLVQRKSTQAWGAPKKKDSGDGGQLVGCLLSRFSHPTVNHTHALTSPYTPYTHTSAIAT